MKVVLEGKSKFEEKWLILKVNGVGVGEDDFEG